MQSPCLQNSLHTLTWCACSWLKAAGIFFFSFLDLSEKAGSRIVRENRKGNFTTVTSQSSKCYIAQLTMCILVNYLQGENTPMPGAGFLQSSQLRHVIHHHLKLSFNRATELMVAHRFKCGCPQIFLTLQQGNCASGSSIIVTSSSPNQMWRMVPDHSSAPKLSC